MASQAAALSNLCISCNVRPKYVEGTKIHPYCGKGCAKKYAKNLQSNPPTTGNCDVCHSRPKCVEGTKTHNYCSKTCAKASTSAAHQTTSPAHTACLMCRRSAKMPDSHYCSTTCRTKATNQAPLILEVPAGHETFKSVEQQFVASWRHPNTCPPVKAIYKIVGTSLSQQKYEMYRNVVEARGKFEASGKSAGNERRRWHGTNRECKLGDKGKTNFCPSTSCPLCCIVKASYDLNFFGKKTGWGRFGSGIYTSSTSSKSNDYSRNGIRSPWKALILNKVVVGKGYKATRDNPSLTGPPQGYDSVLGEKGGSLNHDELIVFDNDAIRPSWLIMYEA